MLNIWLFRPYLNTNILRWCDYHSDEMALSVSFFFCHLYIMNATHFVLLKTYTDIPLVMLNIHAWVKSYFSHGSLTHWDRVTHICVRNLNHHWFRQWLVAWPAPSHYLDQWWNIVNWTLRNKLQWNLNRNSYIFNQEKASKNVVY